MRLGRGSAGDSVHLECDDDGGDSGRKEQERESSVRVRRRGARRRGYEGMDASGTELPRRREACGFWALVQGVAWNRIRPPPHLR